VRFGDGGLEIANIEVGVQHSGVELVVAEQSLDVAEVRAVSQ